MISKSVLGALGCFFLAVIGLERTFYWFLVVLAFLSGSVSAREKFRFDVRFSFLLHLILHRHRWSTVHSLYDRIRTSFLPSRLSTHVSLSPRRVDRRRRLISARRSRIRVSAEFSIDNTRTSTIDRHH